MVRALARVPLAVVALAGCSSSATSTRTFSDRQVIDAFRKQTGKHLVIDRVGSVARFSDKLKLGDADPNSDYGTFTISVTTSKAGATIELTDLSNTPLKRSADGLYWQRQKIPSSAGGGSYWVATKKYGANVFLDWFGGKPTDDSLGPAFDRVNAALGALDG